MTRIREEEEEGKRNTSSSTKI